VNWAKLACTSRPSYTTRSLVTRVSVTLCFALIGCSETRTVGAHRSLSFQHTYSTVVDMFVNSSTRTGVQFSLVRVLCTSPKTFRVSGWIIESRIRWRTGVETETESGDEGSTGTSNGSGRVSTTTLTVAAVIARCPDIRPPGNVLARKLFIHPFIAQTCTANVCTLNSVGLMLK